MRRRWSIGVLAGFALLAFAVPRLEAQYGGRRGGRGGFAGPEGRRRMTPPDPVVREGPPVADDFVRIVEGNDSLKNAYLARRLDYMKETQSARDSLTDFMADLRGTRSGDVERARENRRAMQDLMKGLGERQKDFDEGLKRQLLTKDQWKRYDHWRNERRKEAEKAFRDRWGSRGGS